MRPPPEERLLHLIRGKRVPRAAERPPLEPDAPSAGARLAAHAPRNPWHAVPWPSMAVAGLGTIVGLELLGLLVQALWPMSPVAVPVVASAPSEAPAPATPQAPELSSLAESVSRPLFAAAAPLAATAAPQSGTATQWMARLTLTGIVSGEPAQAIIEDTQTQKTYFVAPGQAIVGGAVVEQILDNRVVLDLAGEKIELTL